MILPDTNVISELMRPNPSSVVVNWFGNRSASSFYISVITELGLRYGIAKLSPGQRQRELAGELEKML